ncbi:MAG: hypothetical protein ACKVJK_17230, partial [Methylophagaceae bacterium]
YSNFTHFSSAVERLENFKYKVSLIESYQNSINSVGSVSQSTTYTSGSQSKYDRLLQGVVNNFDHFEKHLYFESGSTSWPKQVVALPKKPHTNLAVTST